MRKKLLSIVLSVFMLCSSTIGVYAAEDTQAEDASQQETQVVEETETVSSEAPVDKTGYEGMETEVLNVTDKEYNEIQQKNSKTLLELQILRRKMKKYLSTVRHNTVACLPCGEKNKKSSPHGNKLTRM